MLYLDLEVFSEVDISEAPLDVYASHPSTEILLACAALNDGAIAVYERETFGALRHILQTYPTCELSAWNVGFERTILAAKGIKTPLSRWTDAMVEARYVGLPGGLKQACKVGLLGVPAEEATKSESRLIKMFCMPGKQSRTKEQNPDDWAAFVEYCRRDVAALRHIHKYLAARYPFPASERKVWMLDQVINERGLPIDVPTARHAAGEVVRLTGEARTEMIRLTGLENPNSVQQLLPWLQERGYKYDSLGKEFVQAALEAK